MDGVQIVFTAIGTAIACGGLVTPFVLARFAKRDRKIELLETKNELLEKANHKLELQNLELRVTGVALNKLLRQLPAGEETHEESP